MTESWYRVIRYWDQSSLFDIMETLVCIHNEKRNITKCIAYVLLFMIIANNGAYTDKESKNMYYPSNREIFSEHPIFCIHQLTYFYCWHIVFPFSVTCQVGPISWNSFLYVCIISHTYIYMCIFTYEYMLNIYICMYRVFKKNCVFSQFTTTPSSPTSL